MALILTESDVRSILTMPLALEAVEDAFRRLADGTAVCQPRHRVRVPGQSLLNYMAASDAAGGYLGLKIYSISREGARFIIPLFAAESGDLVSLIEADYLGQMRTGAASGVATRRMAREDAKIAGIIGTGLQARTQLEAVAHARKLDSVRAFGRDVARREKFAREMTEKLGLPVKPVTSAEEAVRGVHILITATTAVQPVVEGRWLEPGLHINAVGANFAEKRELDSDAVLRASVIAADSVEQARIEAGDLIQAFGHDASRWEPVRELADIVAGKVTGRTSRDQITLFKSGGIAIEDIVVAGRIYERARERGLGKELPFWRKEAASGGR